MGCLDIVWVIVPPGAAHSFRVFMFGHNIAEIGELHMTKSTLSALLDHFPLEQFPHLCR
jgi:hypothetical protein